MKTIIVTILLTLAMSGSTLGQSAWLNYYKHSSISVEWNKPIFDEDLFPGDYIKSASSVLFITGRFRATDNVRFVVDVPLSHLGYKGDEFFEGSSHTAFGNIYLGGEFDVPTVNSDMQSFFEVGLRIPTIADYDEPDEGGALTGLLAETDRKEAFFNDTWSIPVAANLINHFSGNVALRLRAGVVYDIYTGDLGDFFDNELHLIYAIGTSFRTDAIATHLAFAGRHHAAGNDPSGNGLTQLRAGLSKQLRGWSPAVNIWTPLSEDFNSAIDIGYGVTISVDVGAKK